MRTARAVTVAIIMLGAAPAFAATADGYMTAGGVGGIKCTIFSNALAEARQMGLRSVQGVNHINPFTQYAYGFFTGYNSVSDGVFDILGGIRGDDMDISVLTMADQYCASNPTDNFDDALIDVLKKIFPTALMTKPASLGAGQ